MASKRFKIYKGVASRIYVTVKNSDKKVIPAAGKVFTAYVVSDETNELMLERQLDEINAAAGMWELTLLEGETSSWDTGRFRMVITVTDENGDEFNLYSDLDYGATAELWLEENAMPILKNAAVSDASNWQERSGKFYSSAYAGDAQEGRHDGLHTIAVYLTGYTGQFWVQASLENVAPTADSAWFDINLDGANDFLSLVDTDTIFTLNFNVNAQWIRFVHDPDISNTGTIDQVLYRV